MRGNGEQTGKGIFPNCSSIVAPFPPISLVPPNHPHFPPRFPHLPPISPPISPHFPPFSWFPIFLGNSTGNSGRSLGNFMGLLLNKLGVRQLCEVVRGVVLFVLSDTLAYMLGSVPQCRWSGWDFSHAFGAN